MTSRAVGGGCVKPTPGCPAQRALRPVRPCRDRAAYAHEVTTWLILIAYLTLALAVTLIIGTGVYRSRHHILWKNPGYNISPEPGLTNPMTTSTAGNEVTFMPVTGRLAGMRMPARQP